MILSKIREILFKLGQQQLITGVEQLSTVQLQDFLAQLEKYDPRICSQQKELLFEHSQSLLPTDLPYCSQMKSGNEQDRKSGEALIRQGKVGCLILAGGQGTRLGVDGPKGAVPISPIKGKSLFQIFCERTKAASDWTGQALPLCIMTSPLNHAQTVEFFRAHNHFGLLPAQVSFFEQQMLPFIDDRGHWLLEEPGKVAEGPDGNGHALRLFFTTGLWDQWKKQGIEYLNIIVVDNALAHPFDPELIGCAQRLNVDICLKAVERLSVDEKMGVIAKRNEKLKLIEYSEIPSTASAFTLSNTGLFCVSMEFIRHLYQERNVESPLHLARKSAQVLLGTAKGHIQDKAYVWKCERFIFDLFDHARTSGVLVYPREKIYAPLKNAMGDKSIDTVKQALFSHYRDVYHALTGLVPPAHEFELDPIFYYPSEKLKQTLSQLRFANQAYVVVNPEEFCYSYPKTVQACESDI